MVRSDLVRSVARVSALALVLVLLPMGGPVAHEGNGRWVVARQAEQAQAALAEARMLQRLTNAQERAERSRRPDDGHPQRPSVAAGTATRAPAESESADPPPSGGAPAVGPVPDSCAEYGGNRATGCALLLDTGFDMDQMPCLENLWTRESNWDETAENPSSGAYGIPQALPGSKMSSHGDDWRHNPVTQIRWGLSYIDDRYGTPCGAWGFWQANHWY